MSFTWDFDFKGESQIYCTFDSFNISLRMSLE